MTKSAATADAGRQRPTVGKDGSIRVGDKVAGAAGGSAEQEFNVYLLRATVATAKLPRAGDDTSIEATVRFSTDAAAAFKPTDGTEGMLAAQAIAMHNMVMECSRLAMVPDQPWEIAASLRKGAANAGRTFTELLAALDRKRGKGTQVVRVERVVVHEGGQAIVGNVSGADGGGCSARIEPEPCAPALTAPAAPSPIGTPLWGQDAERAPVLRAGDAQRPMPDARRRQHRATNR